MPYANREQQLAAQKAAYQARKDYYRQKQRERRAINGRPKDKPRTKAAERIAMEKRQAIAVAMRLGERDCKAIQSILNKIKGATKHEH